MPSSRDSFSFAGAFVHLKKQSARPWHPTDGRRMRPAVRLFALATKNLSPYAPQHMGLDVSGVLGLAADHVSRIEASGFSKNPWHPDDRAEARARVIASKGNTRPALESLKGLRQ